jgi:tryptophan-rich sensory protein
LTDEQKLEYKQRRMDRYLELMREDTIRYEILRSPQLAFAEIVILLISIVVTIVIFYKISRLAAVLMMLYAGWVTFASFLNLQIWLLNSS